ncbi:MAG: hypothetical protein NTZ68_03490 [Candidatus Dependentiae bacterium]|nr:hypothetical protein [Candidatus Dependentiae bacterium]
MKKSLLMAIVFATTAIQASTPPFELCPSTPSTRVDNLSRSGVLTNNSFCSAAQVEGNSPENFYNAPTPTARKTGAAAAQSSASTQTDMLDAIDSSETFNRDFDEAFRYFTSAEDGQKAIPNTPVQTTLEIDLAEENNRKAIGTEQLGAYQWLFATISIRQKHLKRDHSEDVEHPQTWPSLAITPKRIQTTAAPYTASEASPWVQSGPSVPGSFPGEIAITPYTVGVVRTVPVTITK